MECGAPRVGGAKGHCVTYLDPGQEARGTTVLAESLISTVSRFNRHGVQETWLDNSPDLHRAGPLPAALAP